MICAFCLTLGEDTQESNHVNSISMNESVVLSYPESSLTNGGQNTSSLNILGITSNFALPPPPPAFFLGYTLPPGHPCNSFTLPPPPADKKRTGPRRKFHFAFPIIPDFLFDVLGFHEVFCTLYVNKLTYT